MPSLPCPLHGRSNFTPFKKPCRQQRNNWQIRCNNQWKRVRPSVGLHYAGASTQCRWSGKQWTVKWKHVRMRCLPLLVGRLRTILGRCVATARLSRKTTNSSELHTQDCNWTSCGVKCHPSGSRFRLGVCRSGVERRLVARVSHCPSQAPPLRSTLPLSPVPVIQGNIFRHLEQRHRDPAAASTGTAAVASSSHHGPLKLHPLLCTMSIHPLQPLPLLQRMRFLPPSYQRASMVTMLPLHDTSVESQQHHE